MVLAEHTGNHRMVLAAHTGNHRRFVAATKFLDNLAVKVCPRLMEYSFHQTILLRKSS